MPGFGGTMKNDPQVAAPPSRHNLSRAGAQDGGEVFRSLYAVDQSVMFRKLYRNLKEKMMKFSQKISLAVAISGLLTLGLLTNTASASHSWGKYHWARTANPFALNLGDNLTAADWKLYLATTSSDWSTSVSPVRTTVVGGQSNKRCSAVSGTTQVCNGTYGNNGWLGLASINITGGVHITQGTAKMNDTYFNKAYYNNPNEKLHVMCQEVAHTFGLGHQSEDGSSQNSCMDYFSNTGANATSTQSTKPNAHDFEQLTSIYAHLDSTTTVSASPTSSAANPSEGVDSDNPNSWGVLRSQTASGRGSYYLAQNRDGSLTVTHVFWTEEKAAKCPSCDHRFD